MGRQYGSGRMPQPSTYGEVLKPLDLAVLTPDLAQIYRNDDQFREWVHVYDRVRRAEKFRRGLNGPLNRRQPTRRVIALHFRGFGGIRKMRSQTSCESLS